MKPITNHHDPPVSSSSSLFLEALKKREVVAQVMHIDHYRVKQGVAIRTDYIILVRPRDDCDEEEEENTTAAPAAARTQQPQRRQESSASSWHSVNSSSSPFFDPFMMSKTFKAFRVLTGELKQACHTFLTQQQGSGSSLYNNLTQFLPITIATSTASNKNLFPANSNNNDGESPLVAQVQEVWEYCQRVIQLIDSQQKQVLGRTVSLQHVKQMAKQRCTVLNQVLHATCRHYPTQTKSSTRSPQNTTTTTTTSDEQFLAQVVRSIQTFFFTDHCMLDDINKGGGGTGTNHKRKKSSSSLVPGGEEDVEQNPILNPLAGFWNMIDPRTVINNKDKEKASAVTNLSNNAKTGEKDTPAAAMAAAPNHPPDPPAAHERSLYALACSSTNSSITDPENSTVQQQAPPTQVIPITFRDRRSTTLREQDALELRKLGKQDVTLEWDDHSLDGESSTRTAEPFSTDSNKTKAQHTTPGTTKPILPLLHGLYARMVQFLWFCGRQSTAVPTLCVVALIGFLSYASTREVKCDADYACLLIFGAYCLGLHTPRTTIVTRTTNSNKNAILSSAPTVSTTTSLIPRSLLTDLSGRRLIQRTMLSGGAKTGHKRSSSNNSSSGTPFLATPRAGSTTMSGKMADATSTERDVTKKMDNEQQRQDEEEQHEQQQLLQEELAGNPMKEFPCGAPLGSVTNCWGKSQASDFKIRGPNYLVDKKKIPSQEFLFQPRGAELLLTDTCPENVGCNPALFHGQLRTVPTFIINFRLPWGVMVLYYEIPSKFIPYIRAGYEDTHDNDIDVSKLKANLEHMTAGERCACRFFMNDEAYKNARFKIVPVVVKGPWVVRSVVGGKPALIGNKLPITYAYEPPNPKTKQALYWEADLDIAASSAARGILSVARAYTQVLTLDLGFVVQGNQQDELPEQMLVGCRLHGVDPLTAPSYPPMPPPRTTATTNNTRGGRSTDDDEDDDEEESYYRTTHPPHHHLSSDDGSVTPYSSNE